MGLIRDVCVDENMRFLENGCKLEIWEAIGKCQDINWWCFQCVSIVIDLFSRDFFVI